MIEATGLTKAYGGTVALHPLDLRVEQGETVALLGHNGSGKTTLIKMAVGVLDPSSGSVRVAGSPAGSMNARAAVAYLADTPSFYDDLSVWEHLEFIARLHGAADWEQSAADLLGHLGIYERADDLPTTFSRGLRQKAAIALAFIRPFDVLLVDEPFVGLDVTGRDALLELFDESAAKGATLIVATHELRFAQRSQRLVVLADGVVVHDGPGDSDTAEEWVRQG